MRKSILFMALIGVMFAPVTTPKEALAVGNQIVNPVYASGLYYSGQGVTSTLQIKIGGRVRQLLTKVRLYLASGHPGGRLWHALASYWERS